jgi:hypothetical protein
MKNILRCALIYFALVFGAGFILGVFRLLVLVPELGERYAELLEMPFMLVVIYYAAAYVMRRHVHADNIASAGNALYIGGLALLLLLSVEFTLVLGLQGISLQQYMDSRDPVSGSAYALSLVAYLLMPYLLAGKSIRQHKP